MIESFHSYPSPYEFLLLVQFNLLIDQTKIMEESYNASHLTKDQKKKHILGIDTPKICTSHFFSLKHNPNNDG